MPVAVVKATLGITDPNDWLIQEFTGVAHGFHKEALKIMREVLITIIGQTIVQSH
jgi:hypothetical protein